MNRRKITHGDKKQMRRKVRKLNKKQKAILQACQKTLTKSYNNKEKDDLKPSFLLTTLNIHIILFLTRRPR